MAMSRNWFGAWWCAIRESCGSMDTCKANCFGTLTSGWNASGRAWSAWCGCILAEDPDTVRFPDVAVLLGQSARNWLHGAPDVAIEVLSPSNMPQGIREKTQDYFDAGALRVWIVDPKARTVLIRRADGASTLFEDKDRLEYPEVLPGFALGMGVLFGGL